MKGLSEMAKTLSERSGRTMVNEIDLISCLVTIGHDQQEIIDHMKGQRQLNLSVLSSRMK